MINKNKPYIARIVFTALTLLILPIFHSAVSAGQADVDALNAYCKQNYAYNLADGTDAEIECRRGDPNNLFPNDTMLDQLWAALSPAEQGTQIGTQCSDIYSDPNLVATCTSVSGTGYVPINNSAVGPTTDCNGVQVSVDVNCVSADNPILGYLGGIVNFLAAGVGVVVVAILVVSGVQYITSRGVPQKVEAAKNRMTNAIIGLISYIFLYAFLQWLIPGGLFG